MAQRDGALSRWIPAGYSEFHATTQHGNFLPANGFAGKREVGRCKFAEYGDSENRRDSGAEREAWGVSKQAFPNWVFAIPAVLSLQTLLFLHGFPMPRDG
jgi:hypothetical protein